jgi:hypothetical protein
MAASASVTSTNNSCHFPDEEILSSRLQLPAIMQEYTLMLCRYFGDETVGGKDIWLGVSSVLTEEGWAGKSEQESMSCFHKIASALKLCKSDDSNNGTWEKASAAARRALFPGRELGSSPTEHTFPGQITLLFFLGNKMASSPWWKQQGILDFLAEHLAGKTVSEVTIRQIVSNALRKNLSDQTQDVRTARILEITGPLLEWTASSATAAAKK